MTKQKQSCASPVFNTLSTNMCCHKIPLLCICLLGSCICECTSQPPEWVLTFRIGYCRVRSLKYIPALPLNVWLALSHIWLKVLLTRSADLNATTRRFRFRFGLRERTTIANQLNHHNQSNRPLLSIYNTIHGNFLFHYILHIHSQASVTPRYISMSARWLDELATNSNSNRRGGWYQARRLQCQFLCRGTVTSTGVWPSYCGSQHAYLKRYQVDLFPSEFGFHYILESLLTDPKTAYLFSNPTNVHYVPQLQEDPETTINTQSGFSSQQTGHSAITCSSSTAPIIIRKHSRISSRPGSLTNSLRIPRIRKQEGYTKPENCSLSLCTESTGFETGKVCIVKEGTVSTIGCVVDWMGVIS